MKDMTSQPADRDYADQPSRRQAPNAPLQAGRRAETLSAIELEEIVNGPAQG